MITQKDKTAIVLGGTHDHIMLIENLKRRGYFTILIDCNENPPAKETSNLFIRESTLNKEAVLKIAEQYKPEIVITACIDQALLTMAYTCEKLKLPCHLSYQKALNLTNKAFMKLILHENEIPTSRFVVLEAQNNHQSFNSELKYPLVVKPSDANSSKGVKKVFGLIEANFAIVEAFKLSQSKKVIVEEFIEGEELSIDVIITDHKAEVLLITRNKKIKDNKNLFTIVQNYFDKEYFDKYKNQIKILAEKIGMAFNLNNVPLLIQVLVKDNALFVIEFSSRIGGGSKHHFIKRLTGFDILTYFIDVIEDKTIKKIDYTVSFPYASVNYIYTKPGKVKSFDGIDTLKGDKTINDFILYQPVDSIITQSKYSTDRIAGFILSANSKKEHDIKCLKSDSTIRVINDKEEDIMLHGLYTNKKTF